MKSFLLLIFSLMAGCEALSTVYGCIGAWAEFTLNCTNTSQNEPIITSPHGKIKSKDAKGRFLWYNGEKNVTLLIKDLKQKDAGKYACKYDRENLHTVELKIQSGKQCLEAFQQTAYTSTKATITCDTAQDNLSSQVKFLCKQEDKLCEDISSTGSKGRFRFTDTNSGFNVTISNVSSEDGGVYWCGLRSENRDLRRALGEITLKVQKISVFSRSPRVGQNFTYWCHYKGLTDKFICKGEDPSACKRVVSTAQTSSNNGRFFLSDDKKERNITITVTHVAVEDAGTYWCTAETSDRQRSDVVFHKFIMTVDGPSPEAPTTSPVPSPKSMTPSAADSHGRVLVITTVIICVVVLLLFVLILIYIYKRFSHSKTTRNGALQPVREDYVYEERQERPRKSDTGNAVNSINVAANFSTASLHYSTINFHKAGGEKPKPSSSGCEYSTLKFSQSPKTVIQPSQSTDDALYSTINKKDHP